MFRRIAIVFLMCALRVHAQSEVVNDKVNPLDLKPLPAGVLLVPGAVASSSDAKTPLPEQGKFLKNTYANRYFGLTWSFPEAWSQEFDGPPPSDSGAYVLANITDKRGSVLITAQDLFFSLTPPRNLVDYVHYAYAHLPKYYKAAGEPAEFTINGHKFFRYGYSAPEAGLQWAVLTTEIRCHTLQFVVTSRDSAVVESLVESLKGLKIEDDGARCVDGYARPQNIESKIDPVFNDNRFNAIPVRFIIGKSGRVQHVHILSAFDDQAKTINETLSQWRFKPYVVNGDAVEIETGILFGAAAARRRDPDAGKVASGQ
jgi:hypothetical protein